MVAGFDGANVDEDELMAPGEVARLFGVDPKTVTRWASAGKLSPLRTLGGHRRYRSQEVQQLLADSRGSSDMLDGASLGPGGTRQG